MLKAFTLELIRILKSLTFIPMKILAIIGSASQESSNEKLLKSIQEEFSEVYDIEIYNTLPSFPLFTPDKLKNDLPAVLSDFKTKVLNSDAVIIATPEYTHNIPAVVKNMIDWCTASGEFYQKKVLPITFTPNPPRGEYAMKSLLQSLKALDMNIVSQLPLYKSDVEFQNNEVIMNDELKSILEEAFQLLH